MNPALAQLKRCSRGVKRYRHESVLEVQDEGEDVLVVGPELGKVR
jgi:hypothetical protein